MTARFLVPFLVSNILTMLRPGRSRFFVWSPFPTVSYNAFWNRSMGYQLRLISLSSSYSSLFVFLAGYLFISSSL